MPMAPSKSNIWWTFRVIFRRAQLQGFGTIGECMVIEIGGAIRDFPIERSHCTTHKQRREAVEIPLRSSGLRQFDGCNFKNVVMVFEDMDWSPQHSLSKAQHFQSFYNHVDPEFSPSHLDRRLPYLLKLCSYPSISACHIFRLEILHRYWYCRAALDPCLVLKYRHQHTSFSHPPLDIPKV